MSLDFICILQYDLCKYTIQDAIDHYLAVVNLDPRRLKISTVLQIEGQIKSHTGGDFLSVKLC